MQGLTRILILLVAVCVVAAAPSCGPSSSPLGTYQVDIVQFELVTAGADAAGEAHDAAAPAASGASPGLWINTNTQLSGLFGGTLKSRRPYSINADYTDNALAFTTLVFTSVAITYEDGVTEPATAALSLPLRIDARDHESVNSVAGGRVVKSTSRVFSGMIPGVITRDESFRLVIEGRFLTADGGVVPFTIDQRYEVLMERGTRSAGEVLQDS